MTGKDAIKRLIREGWKLDRVEGSQHFMIKGRRNISIPVHGNKDLSKGIYHYIAKRAGWLPQRREK